jgi:radical SAM-linked protein
MVRNINKIIMRFRFSKQNDMRYISHLDLITLLIRALRRAKIPILYSSGYHPKPKLSTAFALKVGWESIGEYADIVLKKNLSPDLFKERLNNQLPEGVEILKAICGSSSKSLSNLINCAKYQIILSCCNKKKELGKIKKSQYFREKLFDIKIREIDNDILILNFLTLIGSGNDLDINDFIEFLNSLKNELKFILKRVLRVNMYRKEGDFLLSPFSLLK